MLSVIKQNKNGQWCPIDDIAGVSRIYSTLVFMYHLSDASNSSDPEDTVMLDVTLNKKVNT